VMVRIRSTSAGVSTRVFQVMDNGGPFRRMSGEVQ
jgi:hypothetical protein